MQQSTLMYPHDFSYIVSSQPADDVPAHDVNPLCANPECRQPIHRPAAVSFAGQALCGPVCLEAAFRTTLAAEHGLSTAAALETGPRVRIGQILVEQGVITEAQLERALRSQRLTGAGRLGTWLLDQTQLPEEDFAAALSIQWGCPVFRVGVFAAQRMAEFLPRCLVEKLGALPLRVSRHPERLTICFEDRLDAELLRACQRMHGMRVEAGLMASNEFWHGSAELLKANFPASCLIEATSLDEMIGAMVETMTRSEAVNAQLVYVQGYYWLRMWAVEGQPRTVAGDVLCTVRASAEGVVEGQLADEISAGLERQRALVS